MILRPLCTGLGNSAQTRTRFASLSRLPSAVRKSARTLKSTNLTTTGRHYSSDLAKTVLIGAKQANNSTTAVSAMSLTTTTTTTTATSTTTSKHHKLPPISEPLLLQPANKLSKLIKDGSLTSVHLCELFVERIRQIQPITNAMAQDRFREALEDARKVDQLLASLRAGKPESEFSEEEVEMLRSPLLGVPISVKESIKVKGMKNSCGLWARRNTDASEDAVVVDNVRRFGLIPICTSNVPEGTLFWADCQNTVYGRTVNPYDPSRITGASSGGEGALLGSGASVIGIGSDIGGSLRIPAHYCGIFSHKPSPFLVSSVGNYPDLTENRLRLFTLGPMARYASDLRPLLKCLMSDKDNAKQDTYHNYQPKDIAAKRKLILDKLEEPNSGDLSQLKLFYFDINQESKLKGRQSIKVTSEFMEVQKEMIDHFRSKFNCQAEKINLDNQLKRTLVTWQCMLSGGGCVDRDTCYSENELRETFGINGSLVVECFKLSLGLSTHTKESLLTMLVSSIIPKDREKAYAMCEKFEAQAAEMKAEIESKLGDKGVLILPTLPTVAYKHNVSLLKTADLRFPALFNMLQLPVTQAVIRLDKKHKMPFGFSIAGSPYNDHLTLTVAEEIEQAFGGWTAPAVSLDVANKTGIGGEKQALRMESGNTNNINSNSIPQAAPQIQA